MPATVRRLPGGNIPPAHGRTSTDTRRNIYVSSSVGNDANSGLTPAVPKATIAAGKALMRAGIDDWLLLKMDDEWNEAIGQWTTGGFSQGARQRIGSYGIGTARPKVKSGVSDGIYTTTQVDHLEIRGIHFIADTYDGSSGAPAGIRLGGKAFGPLIQYCLIENYADGIRLDPPVAMGSQISIPEIHYNVIQDIYAQTANPSNGIYLARCFDAVIRYNNISKVGEVDPGLNHHGIYIRGGGTYGCDWANLSGNNVFEVAGTGLLTRANHTFVYNNVFARCAISIAFRGQDPVDPQTTGLIGCDCGNNVITLGRDTNGSFARGWGMVLEHISNPATGFLGLDSAENLYLDSDTATDPHPLIIHPEYPTKNGAGVRLVHWVDGVVWEWHGSIKLNDDEIISSTAVEIRDQVVFSTAGHYIVEHNLANGLHYGASYLHMDCAASGGTQYRYNGQNWSQTQWKSFLIQPTPFIDKVIPTFTDSTRTLATYDTVVGGLGTFADLVTLLRAQSEQNWRWELTGDSISGYLLAGFDV